MSPWAYGDVIAGGARRPSIANGENETNLPGFVASQRFFQSAREDDALAIARQYNVRYVLVGRLFRVFEGDLWQFGLPSGMPGTVAVRAADRMSDAERRRLVYTRLFSWMRTPDAVPLEHFRLVHAGVEQSAPPPNNIFIYEIVSGARLVGTAEPGETIVADLQIAVPGLGSGPLRFVAQSGPNGRFELIVPYATTERNYDVRALAGYRVTGNAGQATIAVSEKAVQQGEEIPVQLSP